MECGNFLNNALLYSVCQLVVYGSFGDGLQQALCIFYLHWILTWLFGTAQYSVAFWAPDHQRLILKIKVQEGWISRLMMAYWTPLLADYHPLTSLEMWQTGLWNCWTVFKNRSAQVSQSNPCRAFVILKQRGVNNFWVRSRTKRPPCFWFFVPLLFVFVSSLTLLFSVPPAAAPGSLSISFNATVLNSIALVFLQVPFVTGQHSFMIFRLRILRVPLIGYFWSFNAGLSL
jgi:hypothetical protein